MLRSSLLLISTALLAAGQANWKTPFPAHKIAGNLHYVGTADLACFLIATPGGHILINTGLADSVPLIRESVTKLGYRLEDIKILLTMQAHYDHVAGLAEIRRVSGAQVYATEADSSILEDGGRSDPSFGGKELFAPVKVDRKLKDGDTIRLGQTELTVHLTPGHSKGSVSYAMSVVENGRKYNVLIANMGTVVMPLVGNTKYPQIADDFARSFRKQKALKPDIWVAAHASQYSMEEKYKAGSFVDPEGYREAVERSEKLYLERLAQEQKTK